MERSLPRLPANARELVLSMLKPESIAIIGGTLIVWAGSHCFGIGEIVDVILLGVGVAVLGLSVIDGAAEFSDFVTGAIKARTNNDLDRAAESFARAVTILGISTIQAMLLRGQGRAVTARPAADPRPNQGLGPSTSGRSAALDTTQPIAGRQLG